MISRLGDRCCSFNEGIGTIYYAPSQTTQAQRPGARDAWIATATLPPGSLHAWLGGVVCGALISIQKPLGECRRVVLARQLPYLPKERRRLSK
jgi:hypothetical protein